MGWTSYHANFYKRSKNGLVIDRKAECDSTFDEGYKILKSVMVGTVHYAAIQKVKRYTKQEDGRYIYVDIPQDEQYVTATVTLTTVDTNDYYNFSYKGMSECMGPFYYDCPLSILKLLSPTTDESALEWRRKCEEKAEQKKSPNTLSKLPIGTRIQFRLGDDIKTVVKYPPAFQFKRPFWYNPSEHTYIPARRIPDDYTVMEAAN